MKCKQCFKEFDGKFCPECGAKAEPEYAVSPQNYQPAISAAPKTQNQQKPFYLKWWFILAVIVTLGIIISVCAASCGGSIAWDEMILGKMLPEPPSGKGEIHYNSAQELWVDIDGVSDKQYLDYIEACKAKGFTVDAKDNSILYEAYNAEGYKLSLSHYSSISQMTIRLDAPMEMTAITWPAGTAGSQLPVPKSTVGKFTYEYDDNFFVYIGNTPRTDYDEYVNACSARGFSVNYDKGEDYYRADNSENWHISLRYEGNSIMSINITAPSTEESTTTTSAVTTSAPVTTQTSAVSNTGIDPDFKAAMDSYESFMNEYVAFMKKYYANPTDISLLAEYSDYMSRYSDFVRDFEKWENKELNAAETAYYIDVQTRVNKKLLEIAS